FGALGNGFTVVIHSDASAEEHDIPALLTRHAVTHFQCTPSQARILLSEPQGRRALSGLREMVLGGEVLPPGVASDLLAAMPAGKLFNMYARTETTVYSVAHHVSRVEQPIPIGTPIANTRLYV